jgi:hypothetical protein
MKVNVLIAGGGRLSNIEMSGRALVPGPRLRLVRQLIVGFGQ